MPVEGRVEFVVESTLRIILRYRSSCADFAIRQFYVRPGYFKHFLADEYIH